MNLAKLKPGEKGTITAIGAIGPLKRRLMDMGVLVGEEVQVMKVAPLGDPHRGEDQELQPLAAQEGSGRDRRGGDGMSMQTKRQ